jgi:GTP-binding protein
MPLFQRAAYAFSVAQPGAPLPESDGEIAFAGRSNAGKSSALNSLAGQRRLAFVSKTPGRTQMINFFSLAPGQFLVDLPGYGFAAAPGTIRSRWDALLGDYLRTRAPLRGLVVVMDIRRPMTELDHRLIDFFWQTGKPIHVLLTKADKLSRAAAQGVLKEVQQQLAALSPLYSVQLFSSLKRTGIEEAEQVVGSWLGLEAKPEKTRPRAAPGAGNKQPRAKGG